MFIRVDFCRGFHLFQRKVKILCLMHVSEVHVRQSKSNSSENIGIWYQQ